MQPSMRLEVRPYLFTEPGRVGTDDAIPGMVRAGKSRVYVHKHGSKNVFWAV